MITYLSAFEIPRPVLEFCSQELSEANTVRAFPVRATIADHITIALVQFSGGRLCYLSFLSNVTPRSGEDN